MTTTTAPESTATGIVTERTWQRVTNAQAIARARGTKPAPEYVPAVARISHLSPTCSQAQGDGVVVVATGLTFEEVLGEWTCGACVPVEWLGGRAVAITQAEIDAQVSAPSYGTGEGHGHGTPEGPSPKQEAFLRSLWSDLATVRGDADPAATVEATIARCRQSGTWTRRNASALIDDAKADLYAARQLATSTPTAPAADLPAGLVIQDRPNRYAGTCALCGGHVAENAGRLAKQGTKWAAVHNDGECGTPTAELHAETSPLADVPAGHYAIPSTGDNDLVFYRVDRPTDGAYAGRVFVKMIVGGHPDSNVRAANVPGILARIEAYGPAAAATLYGTEIGRCHRCNRTLTDEESRRLGIGPECRKHA